MWDGQRDLNPMGFVSRDLGLILLGQISLGQSRDKNLWDGLIPSFGTTWNSSPMGSIGISWDSFSMGLRVPLSPKKERSYKQPKVRSYNQPPL